MCVIMIVDDVDPTLSVVRDCWDSNAFGAGLAWREENAVRWSKGGFDSPTDLHRTMMQLPKPYIVHFRIPTVGDPCEALCHPFPVGGSLALTGSTTDGVLAHNGHWNGWQSAMLRFLGTKRIPDGPWSDSRAMAWIAKQSGIGFLELIDEAQRIVLLTPTRLERYGHWSTNQGIMFSNLTWVVGEGPWQHEWSGRGWRRYDVLDSEGPPINQDEDDPRLDTLVGPFRSR
jgi:hypothetical protein